MRSNSSWWGFVPGYCGEMITTRQDNYTQGCSAPVTYKKGRRRGRASGLGLALETGRLGSQQPALGRPGERDKGRDWIGGLWGLPRHLVLVRQRKQVALEV